MGQWNFPWSGSHAKVTIHTLVHDDSHKAPSRMKRLTGRFKLVPLFFDTTMSNVAQFNVSYEFYYDTHAAVNIQNAFITLSSLDGPVAGTSTGFEYGLLRGW